MKKVCFQPCENTAQRLLGIHATNEPVFFSTVIYLFVNFFNSSAKNLLLYRLKIF
jgi:hypothetical protein